MLRYDIFKEVLVEALVNFMPKEFQDCRVELIKTRKVNQSFDAVVIKPAGDGKRQAAPTISVEALYELYMESGDLMTVFQTVVTKVAESMKKGPELLQRIDFGKAGEQIIMVLVNTEQNSELLQNVPHRNWQDLSIVYKWVIGIFETDLANILINNELANMIGMDEESLYFAAVKNTARMFPPKVESMFEVVKKLWLEDGMSEDMIEAMNSEMPEDSFMYVISNSRNLFGAATILYENVLHELSEKVGSNLYLMPSSVHEFIAVATSGDPNKLAQMVREVNVNEVDLEERLSNQVYHYDKDLGIISMATDTPDKRLDSDTEM